MNRSKLMVIIYLSIIGIFLLIFGFLHIAPIYTSYLLVIFLFIVGYISTEQWITHDAAEFENRFWTFIAFLISAASIITCRDSPFYFPGAEKSVSCWIIVILLTYIAHIYDRYLHRLTLTRNTNIIRRIRSADFDHTHRTNARLLLVELQKQVNSIDLIWMSSTFLNIFFLYYVLSCEQKILQIFSEANQQEINYLLYQCKLPLILYKIKDHKFAQRYPRSELLKLLAEDRIHELNVSSKAILLDALQKLKLSAHSKNEYYVQKIILSTKGNDLSELKCLTDAKGDFNSMLKLVFEDIRNSEIRESILNHIMKQANIQSAHRTMKTKHWKEVLTKFAWMKIISDVDDTLSCSGGSWPKGMDLSYPPKVIYPGVIGFYRELDLGTAGTMDEWDSSTKIGNLAFLSARPHVYKDVAESFSYDTFRILQQNYHLHTSPTLLPGSLDAGGRFMVNLDCEPLAIKKFANFQNYLRIYPEFQFIFIGDNGQGDVRTAELMHEESLVPTSGINASATAAIPGSALATNNNLCRCYIHIVQPVSKSYVKSTLYRKPLLSTAKGFGSSIASMRQEERQRSPYHQKEHKICYFTNYIEAAIDAYYHNLVRISGLRRIMVESLQEFQAIREKAWQMDSPYDESVLINYDTKISSAPGRLVKITDDATIQRLESTGKAAPTTSMTSKMMMATMGLTGATFRRLRSNSRTTPPPSLLSIPPAPSGSPLGTRVKTITVASTESIDSITPPTNTTGAAALVPVVVPEQPSTTTQTVLDSMHKLATTPSRDDEESVQHYHEQLILFTNQTIRSRNGFVKRELRQRELNNHLEIGNQILQDHNLPPVEALDYPQHYPLGKKVMTVFGIGEIHSFRKTDGIYEVEIKQTFRFQRSLTTGTPTATTIITDTAAPGIDTMKNDGPGPVKSEVASESVVPPGDSPSTVIAKEHAVIVDEKEIKDAAMPPATNTTALTSEPVKDTTEERTITTKIYVAGMFLYEL